MTSIEIAGSFDELEDLLRRLGAPSEPILLTKDGVAYVALVPVETPSYADAETEATWASPAFQRILARSRADTAGGRERPIEAIARELGIDAI